MTGARVFSVVDGNKEERVGTYMPKAQGGIKERDAERVQLLVICSADVSSGPKERRQQTHINCTFHQGRSTYIIYV